MAGQDQGSKQDALTHAGKQVQGWLVRETSWNGVAFVSDCFLLSVW